jgi:hypothetical protein
MDSRHRRGMGGVLTKEVESSTSSVPFVALLFGKQSWQQLHSEMKWTNAGLAVGAAGLLALRRRRLPHLQALKQMQ